ncbi:hypothetical protein GLOTRDRAFT_120553 [Gloeophyllum trabeum ATCC 11539]|uniref:Uncharacterized protein n=1 Tax=Gloeophyllum trabeum (strain ATCC 11539 / FP-39264 / Madison 617) TaxID=670483 RepID=S7QDC1_GLOTA|nr:uncharacterized protein GLOTRDRAFT_120553 [Gloeophyllum trabeum ATCC 11539]EPQ57332.1 hypothetical protein GLOTRDRAFT_120553 [Gloeophyllum trabeum ATCC 11539]
MLPTTLLAFALSLHSISALSLQRRAVEFYDPAAVGGSMVDSTGNGLGEPLNVIISGLSSPAALTDSGIVNYAQAIGYSKECLGLHSGAPQTANLGDGNGWTDQLLELRADYHSTAVGTCLESVVGGNHFRVWRQNGSLADSGALFLAVSKEKSFIAHHSPIADGYDIGRDELVQAALGTKSHGGVTYSTVARNVSGLIAPGAEGINHGIAQDGVVTVLTVTIVG